MKSIDKMLDEVAKVLNPDTPQTVNCKKSIETKKTEEKSVIQNIDTLNVLEKKESNDNHVSTQSACIKYDKLTLSLSKEIAYAIEIAAEKMGINVVIAINDEGANLTLLHSMEDSFIASIKVAQDKAYTAVALKMPTHEALNLSRGGALDGLTNGNGIMLLGGGYPLKIGNKIYGGVGVSGGTKDEDACLAKLGSEYFLARIKN